jgi:hypothetical protein
VLCAVFWLLQHRDCSLIRSPAPSRWNYSTSPSLLCAIVVVLPQLLGKDRRGSIRISWRPARMRVYHMTVVIGERRSVARVRPPRAGRQVVRFGSFTRRHAHGQVRCWGVCTTRRARQTSVNPFERVLAELFVSICVFLLLLYLLLLGE